MYTVTVRDVALFGTKYRLVPIRKHTQDQRFWAKVDKTDTCWLWTAAKHGPGYGRFKADGFTWLAHRWAYIQAHGTIPDGLVLDHLCRQPSCVRPSHLEVVTGLENKQRQVKKKKLRVLCAQGHPYTPENTGYRKDGRGRFCRACQSRGYRKA